MMPKFSTLIYSRILSRTFSRCSISNQTSGLGEISLEEYKTRRKNLAEKVLHFLKSDGTKVPRPEPGQVQLLIIPSGAKKFMVDKIPYLFRQSTDFRYLTGHLGPDSVLFLRMETNTSGSYSLESTLFLPDYNKREELWEGPKIKPDEAPLVYGVDVGLKISELSNYLRSFRINETNLKIWYDHQNPTHPDIHRVLMDFAQPTKNTTTFESPRKFLHELRLIKSWDESELMRRACQIGSEAIQETIHDTHKLESEAQAFASVDYYSRMKGAQYLAYPPVVAYGVNANTIHYTKNCAQFGDRKGMVLMDAGCEYQGYSSDITRVWPVSGKFSCVQKLVYESVLSIQESLIDTLRTQLSEEVITVDLLYHKMLEMLGRQLKALGLVRDDLPEDELRVACTEVCPHHVAHYLGMDVHDTALVPKNIPLQPGMVITIEPGMYLPFSNKLSRYFPENRSEFFGIGIRIEDDILIRVGDDGRLTCEVLTSSCPKTVKDIESLM